MYIMPDTALIEIKTAASSLQTNKLCKKLLFAKEWIDIDKALK